MKNGRKNCEATYKHTGRAGRCRNRIEILLIILVLSFMTVEAAGERPVSMPKPIEEVVDYTEDETFFESDMDYYRYLMTIASEIHGVDPILAISISRLETGNWKNIKKHYNFGGLTGPDGVYQYTRETEGLEAYMRCLEWYRDNGMATIDTMAKTYCTNDEWAKLVKQIYKEEKKYESTN